jgi:hypothetical protein
MKRYILLPLLLLALMACYKDKGNYTYLPLKHITIDTLLNLKRYYKDSLAIDPVVKFDKGTEDELEFQWTMYPTSEAGGEVLPAQPEVIGNTKALRFQINKDVRRYPYIVVLRVKDKATGVSTYRHFEVMVLSLYSSGWMVLNDRNNISDVDIISLDDSVFREIYKLVNGKTIPGKGVRLSLAGTYSGADELFIQTTDNLIQVRNPEFDFLQDATTMFYSTPAKVQPQFMTISSSGTQRYLINDGQAYVASTLNNGKYGMPLVGDYIAAPFIAAGSLSCIYDKKNGRFMKFPALANGVTMEPFTELKPDQKFDVNNVKGEQLYVEMGPDLAYNFFRNPNGTIQLYGLNVYSNDAPGAFTQLVDAPEMQQATAFSVAGKLPLVYFATGNSLYVYDIGANKARKLYDFPAGSSVSVIRMLKEYFNEDDNAILEVGVNNGAEGTVYSFRLAGTGDFLGGTYQKKFGGFGRITDIIYKSK